MSTTICSQLVERTIAFHGHICPGLTSGIRVAEIALREIGPHAEDEELVAVVETDSCGVDAIQYLVGCTFGKGNLIHLDHGQSVFTFSRRSDGKTVRISARPKERSPEPGDVEARLQRLREGTATEEELAAFTSTVLLERRLPEVDAVLISALKGWGLSRLLEEIASRLFSQPTG